MLGPDSGRWCPLSMVDPIRAYPMGQKRRRRRFWADDEKRRIVVQTRVPGVSVSQVARRYEVNANMVFRWLRDPRFNGCDGDAASFLPVEVISGLVSRVMDATAPDGKIEITLCEGHRVVVSGAFDPEAVSRLIRGLCV
jgi:transposase